MPHKRYQSPSRGYSRRQHKALADLVIEEDLAFDDEFEHARFNDGTITSLMARADPDSPSPEPIEAVADASARPPAEPVTMSELMADSADGVDATARASAGGRAVDAVAEPAPSPNPEHAPVTRVVRGATSEPEAEETNPNIARLDRVLAALRRVG